MCPQPFGREDTFGNPGHLFTFGSPVMATLSVITAKKAHEHVKSGSALLVCAYDSDEKFNNAQLDGAISLNQFKVQAQAGNVSKDKEIIFY